MSSVRMIPSVLLLHLQPSVNSHLLCLNASHDLSVKKGYAIKRRQLQPHARAQQVNKKKVVLVLSQQLALQMEAALMLRPKAADVLVHCRNRVSHLNISPGASVDHIGGVAIVQLLEIQGLNLQNKSSKYQFVVKGAAGFATDPGIRTLLVHWVVTVPL
uniref:Putative secreted peptide n=1 Tax=Anopheles braziliensis TaxID=58242 RepID=A0A2M3ZR80_9DIPT